MSFTLKQALEFNKFTTAISAGGLVYASTVASEAGALSATVKLLGTGAILFFAASVLFGALVIGRASRIESNEDEQISDSAMMTLGKWHSWTLLLGLGLSGLLMLNKIWKFF
jgi:hypothetical protein